MSRDPPRYDVFIDLTSGEYDAAAVHDYIGRLVNDPEAIGGAAGRFTLSVRQRDLPLPTTFGPDIDFAPGQPAVEALARAFRFAAAARRHLVLMLGPMATSGEVLSRLVECFDLDPMFGTSQPRFADQSTGRIWPVPGSFDRLQAAPKNIGASLLRLPGDVITPELLACCVALRWELLNGAEFPGQDCNTVAEAVQRMVRHARRQGFRNLVLNRTVVSTSLGYAGVYPLPAPGTLARIYVDADDPHAQPLNELAGLSQARLESLLDATCPDAAGRVRLLLDCRGLLAHDNGTATCILGFLGGFVRHVSGWDIHVLSTAEAARYHGLAERYPQFRHLTDGPEGEYAAGILLNQPWQMSQVAGLHRQAFVTAFLMLDTIAWDIYPGWMHVDAAWRFIADHADGLCYISQFTKQRFNRRFPVSPDVAETVTHLSFAQHDHAASPDVAKPVTKQILIFGNDYVHKDIRPTAQLLADAFPFHQITVLGMADAPRQNIAAVPSGRIPRHRLQRIVESAGVIVFPSFYEGFGLPVVEGLAHGRPVLVRRSPLWAEIAAFSRLPGRLIEFDDPPSLIEGVGRVLAGLPVKELPSGVALPQGTEPADWTVCAQRIIDVVASRLASPKLDHWWRREHALRMTD